MNLTDYSTLTFDCYGTLIDWEAGILAVLAPWAARNGLGATDDILLETFGRIEGRVQNDTPAMLYPDVLRAVQRGVAADFGIAASDVDAEALGTSVGDWPAFPDSREALAYLKKHYKLVILSNIDNASFALSNERLGGEFDAIVTAQEVGSYKPDLNNFRVLLDRLAAKGIAKGDILHTAQSLHHDVAPAQRIGLATNWINRRHDRPGGGATLPSDAVPDVEHTSMAHFVDAHRAAA